MKIAAREDRPKLTALWEACFGDPNAVVEGFWAAMWDTITVFTNEDGTAMATAMPLSWQEKQAAYLYAVATDPAHQGRGLCRRLMADAEAYLKEQGYSYALLSPAKPSFSDSMKNSAMKRSFSVTGGDFPRPALSCRFLP